LIKITRNRFAATVAAVTLASAAFGLASGPAFASSPGCSAAPGGSCGDEVNANLGWAVQTSHPRANTPVVTARASDTTAATDFYAFSTNKNASERVFEYAPNGHPSGLCIDDASWSGLVLRQCNKGTQQQFYGLGDTQNDQGNTNNGIEWLNAASGEVIVPQGNKPGSPLVTISLDAAAGQASSYFHWAA
jgi:hypothetical protein